MNQVPETENPATPLRFMHQRLRTLPRSLAIATLGGQFDRFFGEQHHAVAWRGARRACDRDAYERIESQLLLPGDERPAPTDADGALVRVYLDGTHGRQDGDVEARQRCADPDWFKGSFVPEGQH